MVNDSRLLLFSEESGSGVNILTFIFPDKLFTSLYMKIPLAESLLTGKDVVTKSTVDGAGLAGF